jgi:hypothetical protein
VTTIEISAIERTQKLKFSDGFWDLAKDMACKSDWHPAIFSVRLECFVSGGIFIVTAKVDSRPGDCRNGSGPSGTGLYGANVSAKACNGNPRIAR